MQLRDSLADPPPRPRAEGGSETQHRVQDSLSLALLCRTDRQTDHFL